MKIKFKGLNVSLGKNDEFEFEHPNKNSRNLNEFYLTFESIYYLDESTKKPYILKMELDKS